jgi:hypothetical protein
VSVETGAHELRGDKAPANCERERIRSEDCQDDDCAGMKVLMEHEASLLAVYSSTVCTPLHSNLFKRLLPEAT